MFRVALVGAGNVAGLHAAGWQANPDARLSLVIDAAPGVAERRAAQWNVSGWATDLSSALGSPDIEVVDLCIPHHLHAEFAIKALQAGKHVLLEKPIARDEAEAETIIAAARAARGRLMIAENWYYAPAVTRARALVEEGAIGDLYKASGFLYAGSPRAEGGGGMAWRDEAKLSGGGFLIDAGIHSISVLRNLMGEVAQVSAVKGIQALPRSVEDTIDLLLTFKSGATATYELVWQAALDRTYYGFRLFGTRGALEFDIAGGTVTLLAPGTRQTFLVSASEGFTEEIAAFTSHLRNGTSFLSDPVDQLKSLAVVRAAYRSAEDGGAPKRPEA